MALILTDTNLLLRSADSGAAMHSLAVGSISALIAAGHDMCVTPQNFFEFWSAATRPKKDNGIGWDAEFVVSEIERIRREFVVLADRPEILDLWLPLARSLDIKGKRAHDARLAAIMGAHGVLHLLTFNGKDFASFPNVTVLAPADVVAGNIAL